MSSELSPVSGFITSKLRFTRHRFRKVGVGGSLKPLLDVTVNVIVIEIVIHQAEAEIR